MKSSDGSLWICLCSKGFLLTDCAMCHAFRHVVEFCCVMWLLEIVIVGKLKVQKKKMICI